MIQFLDAAFNLIHRDPAIIVMGMILLIAYYADEIDRW